MVSSSTILFGSGEATTRRQPRPASSTMSHPSARRSAALSASMNDPIGFDGLWKAGSAPSTSTWVTMLTTRFGTPMRRRSFCRFCCRA